MQGGNQTESSNRIKKKLVIINTCLYGSTGKIVRQLERIAGNSGFDVWTATAYERKPGVKYQSNDIVIGNFFSRYLHLFLSRYTGLGGAFSLFSTWAFVNKIRRINPDCIHIHNLHNAYINIPVLFSFLGKRNLKTIWTFHDCWPFTGRCPYFDISNCEKWKNGCGEGCPFPKMEYPISYINNTHRMLEIKKNSISKLKNLTIVTPSYWLAEHVKNSYLRTYDIAVINNGIDLSVFFPCESDIRAKYKIKAKYMVLGVALAWDRRKGLDVFIKLNEMLDSRYQIVLVGINEKVRKSIPESIICINRTSSQKELAQLYSSADVFLNPTREDNFPTVNIEAIACGTPVITFDTGGSPEILDKSCGTVIKDGDDSSLVKAICDICENKVFTKTDCVNRAQLYDMNDKFKEYIELYQ